MYMPYKDQDQADLDELMQANAWSMWGASPYEKMGKRFISLGGEVNDYIAYQKELRLKEEADNEFTYSLNPHS